MLQASLEFLRETPLGSMPSTTSNSTMDRLSPEAREITAVSNSTCYIAYVLCHPVYDSVCQSDVLNLQWHTTTSVVDEKWTEEVFKKAFGKPFDQVGDFISPAVFASLTRTQISLDDFGAAAGRVFSQSKAPKDREFGGYVLSLLNSLFLFF